MPLLIRWVWWWPGVYICSVDMKVLGLVGVQAPWAHTVCIVAMSSLHLPQMYYWMHCFLLGVWTCVEMWLPSIRVLSCRCMSMCCSSCICVPCKSIRQWTRIRVFILLYVRIILPDGVAFNQLNKGSCPACSLVQVPFMNCKRLIWGGCSRMNLV
jgi:hypothetical protein